MNFISYQEALKIVASHPYSPKTESVNLDKCLGRVLAEDIKSDRDLPPYDRVTMDGIAIHFSDWENGCRSFEVEGTIGAGDPQGTLNGTNSCVEIMTGASMPKGADTVIRYEDVNIKDGHAALTVDMVRSQQNVHFKGMDKKEGDVVLTKGLIMGPAAINMAASVGAGQLPVSSLPKVAIISTGNELVDVQDTPLPHQIRKSNVLSIHSQLQEWGLKSDLFHLKDNKEEITSKISQLVKGYDALIMSGGVSKGKFDHVPGALQAAGITQHFHKVKERPGKPFWFGSGEDTIVFGLPGNPVSTFMCLQVYVRHWLEQSLNWPSSQYNVQLADEVQFKPDLTYFLQCKTEMSSEGVVRVTPVIGNGSGDFSNLIHADGFIVLPPGQQVFSRGEVYPFIPFN